MFDHLREARTQLSFIQGFQKATIDEDGLWLSKRADNIFNIIQIYTRLASYRSIHLRKQCRWYLDKIDPSLERRSCKPAQIRHHPATNINHQRFAFHTKIQHGLPDSYTVIDIFI